MKLATTLTLAAFLLPSAFGAVDLFYGISNAGFSGTTGACPAEWTCSGSPDPGVESYVISSTQYPNQNGLTVAHSPTTFGGSGVVRQVTPFTWVGGASY